VLDQLKRMADPVPSCEKDRIMTSNYPAETDMLDPLLDWLRATRKISEDTQILQDEEKKQ